MAARPLVPECRRRPVGAAVALVLVTAMVMAAGCTERAPDTQIPGIITTASTIALTDRELAERSIIDAEGQIHKADREIGWFKGNESTRIDSQLPAIITKREVAVSYVSTAQDDIANGDYTGARQKAGEAYEKANESYNDALKRQHEYFHSCPGGLFSRCID